VAAHCRRAVARQLDEIERVVDWYGAREIGDERKAGFQRPDEERLAVAVLACDLGAELGNPPRDFAGVEIDLADAGIELDQEALRSP
jgi:hypothetical protein